MAGGQIRRHGRRRNDAGRTRISRRIQRRDAIHRDGPSRASGHRPHADVESAGAARWAVQAESYTRWANGPQARAGFGSTSGTEAPTRAGDLGLRRPARRVTPRPTAQIALKTDAGPRAGGETWAPTLARLSVPLSAPPGTPRRR